MLCASPALSRNSRLSAVVLLIVAIATFALSPATAPSQSLRADTAAISGTKWNDANGNGTWDAGEPGLENWIIYLDENQNGQREQGEPFTLTDLLGRYSFTDLAPGEYVVAEEQQQDWRQTHPDNLQTSASFALETTSRLRVQLSKTASKTPLFLYSQTSAPRLTDSTNLINLNTFRSDPRFADIKGKDYAVAILDTGIDLDHPFFGPDRDSDGVADRIVYSYDFADKDNDASDHDGHGSNVSSIIASEDNTYTGIAPEANIVHLKVFADDGSGDFDQLEDGLQWIIKNATTYNIVAVNMSLGDGNNYTGTISRYGIGDEISLLNAMGIILVSASGNDYYTHSSNEGVAYPAADDDVLAVGAVYDQNIGEQTYSSGAKAFTTGRDRMAPFTQRHRDLLAILAPGTITTGADKQGGTISLSGTSQACPHITGIAALAQQLAERYWGRKLTPAEFTDILRATATTIHDGDDEDDNVTNTNRNYPRAELYAMACKIYEMSILRGTHRIVLAEGEAAADINFGNKNTADLTPPEPVIATDGEFFDKVNITWTSDNGETWFCVYRSTSIDGPKIKLGNGQQETSYDDITGAPEIVYYYFVRQSLDPTGIVTGPYSLPDTGWRYVPPPLPAPTNMSASNGTFLNMVSLHWNEMENAFYYRVFRATDAESEPEPLSDWAASNAFLDTTAVPDYPYYYYVKAASNATGDRESPLSSPAIGRRGVDSAVPAPTFVKATDGESHFQIRISWLGSARSSHFRLYRAETLSDPLTLLSDWQTEREYNDYHIEQEKLYFYAVQAAADAQGLDAGPISSLEHGHAAQSEEMHLKVTARNCTIEVEDGTRIRIVNTLPNATLKILRQKRLPTEMSQSPRIRYLSPVSGISEISIEGSLKKIFSQVAIGSINATGSLGSVSAKPCRIDTLRATSFKSIKMLGTARQDTSNIARHYARIIAMHPYAPTDLPPLSISLTGISLAELHAPGQEITLKASSKTSKNANGVKALRIADIAKVSAGIIRSLSVKGGELFGPITATRSISKISVKTMRIQLDSTATLFGGQAGTTAAPIWIAAEDASQREDQSISQDKIPVLINRISADRGVYARIICGYDTRPDRPTFAGALGAVITRSPNKGSTGIWGMSCVHPVSTDTTKFKGNPLATALNQFSIHTSIEALLPENDLFSNAILIQGANGTTTASNLWASREPGEPPHAIQTQTDGKSLWWRWTPNQSNPVTFDTVGSDFDTLLAIYTGDSIGNLMPVAWNDNAGQAELAPLVSKVSFHAEAGQTYHIAIDGAFHNDQPLGNIVLNWKTP